MSEQEPPETLSEDARRAIRRELRKNTSARNKVIGRIRRIVAYPPVPSDDVRNYRIGISLIGIAILMAVTVLALPRKKGTWLFLAVAWLLAWGGAWRIDKARRKR